MPPAFKNRCKLFYFCKSVLQTTLPHLIFTLIVAFILKNIIKEKFAQFKLHTLTMGVIWAKIKMGQIFPCILMRLVYIQTNQTKNRKIIDPIPWLGSVCFHCTQCFHIDLGALWPLPMLTFWAGQGLYLKLSPCVQTLWSS